jgi:hypothetical protein
MFRALTAHHQEVRCMYVANGTSKMTASEPGLADSLLYPPKKRQIGRISDVVRIRACGSDFITLKE